MDLNTIKEVKRPTSTEDIVGWSKSHAWLAGGTWLFSEPQLAVDTLVDLEMLGWPSLQVTAEGLDVAATCRIAELEHFVAPSEWSASPLLPECCRALLMSFKVANEATVGGNICMSLPAGAMISLTVALEAVYRLMPRHGDLRDVKASDFVIGNHANVLAEGELLRAIHIPATALAKRFAFRRASLTRFGRSAALLIGTCNDAVEDILFTITAATPKPIQLRFQHFPSADVLRRTIDDCIPRDSYFDDVHGAPAYKRHLTYHFAEQIRVELAAATPGAHV